MKVEVGGARTVLPTRVLTWTVPGPGHLGWLDLLGCLLTPGDTRELLLYLVNPVGNKPI